MIVYVTKYWATRGILKYDIPAEDVRDGRAWIRTASGYWQSYKLGVSAFDQWKDALKRVLGQRNAKIQAHFARITNLRAMAFAMPTELQPVNNPLPKVRAYIDQETHCLQPLKPTKPEC